jgi:hypothetical protein
LCAKEYNSLKTVHTGVNTGIPLTQESAPLAKKTMGCCRNHCTTRALTQHLKQVSQENPHRYKISKYFNKNFKQMTKYFMAHIGLNEKAIPSWHSLKIYTYMSVTDTLI